MTAPAPLAPVTAEQAAPPVAELFAEFARTGAAVPPVYRMLAHSPRMLQAWHGFAAPLRAPGDLPADVKELAILRAAHVTGSARQWRHHLPPAAAAGVTPAQIEAVQNDPESLDGAAGAAVALAGALCDGTDATTALARARESLGDALAVEVVVTITYYRCLAGLVGAFGLT
ncbi:carboxymuconolactone decarboxylase family protein [Pseudonocardia sp. CA-107938]|uniref:carboxymuconolactone decarboxylase family protein n=1 Tax=Pseudonocardia sp. CA-107938 TaxID=3240021 RepID=UPI003D9504AB